MSEKEGGSSPPSQPSTGPDNIHFTGSLQASEVASWKLASPVVIWFRHTQSMSGRAVDQARSMLSSDEIARADRFVFERDRRDFIAAHALLRCVLSHHGQLPPDGWKFGSEAAGKPYLVHQSELQLNLAHTRGLVACALSMAGPIGIDVESIDGERDMAPISENHFAQTEVAELRACEEGMHRQTRFTELWTLKEAYLKALGAGLGRPLDEVAFHFSGASELHATAQDDLDHPGWRFALFAPLENYRVAVAVRTNANLAFFARQWPDERDRPSLAPLRSAALAP